MKAAALLALPDFHGLAVQLDHVTGTALLAAHGAHLAVHLHGTALHQLLGFAAGLAQAGKFEQGIQLDKLGMNKNISMSIRVSDEELEKIKKAAEKQNYSSYSEFVRRTALIEAERVISDFSKKKEEHE